MYSSTKRKGSSRYEVMKYTLPIYHSKKNHYVDFLAYDPVSGTMRRKKYMLDHIKLVSARKAMAAELIANITKRLQEGWSPWAAELETVRQYAKFDDVLYIYKVYIEKLTASKSLKRKTCYDYTSRLKILMEYNQQLHTPIIYIYQFNQGYLCDFLDWLLLDRDATPRTRNNYRTWLSALCSWLCEKKYLEANPVEHIKSLPEHGKKRSALTSEDLAQLRQHLTRTNKHYLLACMMEYYTFIRPDELSNIRLKDISISEQKVYVSSTISKNRRDGMVGLNDTILRMMADLKVFEAHTECYLFGHHFKPSEQKADSRIFREYFAKVRRELRWPDSYMFYSLKDSGIRDLANAEGIVVARDQARHSDVSVTNKYLQGSSMTVHVETKHFKGGL